MFHLLSNTVQNNIDLEKTVVTNLYSDIIAIEFSIEKLK